MVETVRIAGLWPSSSLSPNVPFISMQVVRHQPRSWHLMTERMSGKTHPMRRRFTLKSLLRYGLVGWLYKYVRLSLPIVDGLAVADTFTLTLITGISSK